jgi:hypothetical protein
MLLVKPNIFGVINEFRRWIPDFNARSTFSYFRNEIAVHEDRNTQRRKTPARFAGTAYAIAMQISDGTPPGY